MIERPVASTIIQPWRRCHNWRLRPLTFLLLSGVMLAPTPVRGACFPAHPPTGAFWDQPDGENDDRTAAVSCLPPASVAGRWRGRPPGLAGCARGCAHRRAARIRRSRAAL